MAEVKEVHDLSGGCLVVYDDNCAIVVDGYGNMVLDDEAESLADELGVDIRCYQLVDGWEGVDEFLANQGVV